MRFSRRRSRRRSIVFGRGRRRRLTRRIRRILIKRGGYSV